METYLISTLQISFLRERDVLSGKLSNILPRPWVVDDLDAFKLRWTKKSWKKSDEEIRRDRKEREQLEKSIRERDAAGTRKLIEQKISKKDEEEAIRRSKALEEDSTDTLRKVSRQEYLKKREQKKLDELRDAIEDEKYLFEGQKLTEVELREFNYKKELLELAEKRSKEDDNINEYRMPEAYDVDGGTNQEKRFSVAMQRYRDDGAGKKMNPFAEQVADIILGIMPFARELLKRGAQVVLAANDLPSINDMIYPELVEIISKLKDDKGQLVGVDTSNLLIANSGNNLPVQNSFQKLMSYIAQFPSLSKFSLQVIDLTRVSQELVYLSAAAIFFSHFVCANSHRG